MDKEDRHELVTVTVITVACALVVSFIIIGVAVIFQLQEQREALDDFKDDIEPELIVKVPYYNYTMSNALFTLTLGNISIDFEIDYYSVSFVLNDNDKYDMELTIEGLYLNVSIQTEDNIQGGTITLDEFHFESVVDEATPDALAEAVSGQINLEQWTMEA